MANGVNGGYRSIFGLSFQNKKITVKKPDTDIEFVSEIEALKNQQAQISNAKNQAALGNKTYSKEQSQKAQQQIEDNKQKQTQAISATTAAQAVLSATLSKITSANAAVSTLSSKVSNAQAQLTTAQNGTPVTNPDGTVTIQQDEAAIQAAQSLLNQAEAELANAQKELTNAQKEAEQATKAVEEAQDYQKQVAEEIEQMAFAEDDETAEASSEEALNDFTEQIEQYSETLTELSNQIASLQEQLSKQQTIANENLEGYETEDDDTPIQSPLTFNEDGTVTRLNADGTTTTTETKMVNGELVTNEITANQADETADDEDCKKDPIVIKFPNEKATNGYECYVLMDSTSDKRESGHDFDSTTGEYDSANDFFGSSLGELDSFKDDNGNISIEKLQEAGIRLVLSDENGRPIDFDGQPLSENDEVRVADTDVWGNIINYSFKYTEDNLELKLYNSNNEEINNTGILVHSSFIKTEEDLAKYGLTSFEEGGVEENEPTSNEDVSYGYKKYTENKADGKVYVSEKPDASGHYTFTTHAGKNSYVCNIIEGLYGVNYASAEGKVILETLRDLNATVDTDPHTTGIDFYYDKHEGGNIYGDWGMVYAEGTFTLPTYEELNKALQTKGIDNSKIKEILAGIPNDNANKGILQDPEHIKETYENILNGKESEASETTYKDTVKSIFGNKYLSNEDKVYLLGVISDKANSDNNDNAAGYAKNALKTLRKNYSYSSQIQDLYTSYLSKTAASLEDFNKAATQYNSITKHSFIFEDTSVALEAVENLYSKNEEGVDFYDILSGVLNVTAGNIGKQDLIIGALKDNDFKLTATEKLGIIEKIAENEDVFKIVNTTQKAKRIREIFKDVDDYENNALTDELYNSCINETAVGDFKERIEQYQNLTGSEFNFEKLADANKLFENLFENESDNNPDDGIVDNVYSTLTSIIDVLPDTASKDRLVNSVLNNASNLGEYEKSLIRARLKEKYGDDITIAPEKYSHAAVSTETGTLNTSNTSKFWTNAADYAGNAFSALGNAVAGIVGENLQSSEGSLPKVAGQNDVKMEGATLTAGVSGENITPLLAPEILSYDFDPFSTPLGQSLNIGISNTTEPEDSTENNTEAQTVPTSDTTPIQVTDALSDDSRPHAIYTLGDGIYAYAKIQVPIKDRIKEQSTSTDNTNTIAESTTDYSTLGRDELSALITKDDDLTDLVTFVLDDSNLSYKDKVELMNEISNSKNKNAIEMLKSKDNIEQIQGIYTNYFLCTNNRDDIIERVSQYENLTGEDFDFTSLTVRQRQTIAENLIYKNDEFVTEFEIPELMNGLIEGAGGIVEYVYNTKLKYIGDISQVSTRDILTSRTDGFLKVRALLDKLSIEDLIKGMDNDNTLTKKFFEILLNV